ncbi:MAG: YbaB/EbfC family nucleoid-associated protein [Bacteroidota bacterium]|nr:YbaB/EbfC family nucleoid-associated protein [Bacteroidota bacterium]
MFGKLGDMMGKLQEAKKKMAETKAKLATIEMSAESKDGNVKVVVDGNRKIKSLKISEKLQQGSNAELESQILFTLTEAIEKADAANEAEMKKIAMGMLPGGGLF